MLSLSYNISFELKKNLDAIDRLREKILLTSVSPRYEQKLKWDVLIKKLKYSALLSGHNLDSSTIVKLLSQTAPIAETRHHQELIMYKRALDYITEEWIANPNPISARVIRGISNMISTNPSVNNAQFVKTENEIQHLLEYLQSRPDHPIVPAAISYIKILDFFPGVHNASLLAQLTANLFMYKYGFDVKGLVAFEEFFYKNVRTYQACIDEVIGKGKLSLWLEYFAYAVAQQLTKISLAVATPLAPKDPANRLWRLTERQKEILHKLQEPGSRITNRTVQKMFGISQITASRDLAKLAKTGLLLPHGKGRSVYYIKA